MVRDLQLSAKTAELDLRLQDEAAFFAEYQNEPLPAETANTTARTHQCLFYHH